MTQTLFKTITKNDCYMIVDSNTGEELEGFLKSTFTENEIKNILAEYNQNVSRVWLRKYSFEFANHQVWAQIYKKRRNKTKENEELQKISELENKISLLSL